MGQMIRLLLTLIFVFFVLVVMVIVSNAHDKTRPDLDAWFSSLYNNNHVLCCSNEDGHGLKDYEWDMKTVDGQTHYRVNIDDQWFDVPDEALVPGPNKAGHAILWSQFYNGQRVIRCFMPGTLT